MPQLGPIFRSGCQRARLQGRLVKKGTRLETQMGSGSKDAAEGNASTHGHAGRAVWINATLETNTDAFSNDVDVARAGALLNAESPEGCGGEEEGANDPMALDESDDDGSDEEGDDAVSPDNDDYGMNGECVGEKRRGANGGVSSSLHHGDDDAFYGGNRNRNVDRQFDIDSFLEPLIHDLRKLAVEGESAQRWEKIGQHETLNTFRLRAHLLTVSGDMPSEAKVCENFTPLLARQ
ncbi:hypothetical protein QFC20_001593 [Naganishia adeliensis]|uniref:Uncharacterized protein n=1 Tax=Naganishia adeliensis TaxID=92952 RepID=A0ACC2WTG6_9TREE|nr:hypothetical protein QFC20_001593 [Naganishia adeliensis]